MTEQINPELLKPRPYVPPPLVRMAGSAPVESATAPIVRPVEMPEQLPARTSAASPSQMVAPEATMAPPEQLPQPARTFIPQNQMVPQQATTPEPAKPSAAQAELQRLTVGPEAKTGADQIKNRTLRILGKMGAGILDTVLPAASISVPGTGLHHELLVHQAQRNVANEDELANTAAKRDLESAQTETQEAMPELNRTKQELAQNKFQSADELGRAKQDLAQTVEDRKASEGKIRQAADLARDGFKMDPTGKVVPLTYEEMSEEQQALHDLRGAQTEAAEAAAALKKAQAENQPQQIELQRKRLASAEQAHQIASRRLNLSEQQFEMRAFGTNNGEALPGTLQTGEGKTVGTANAINVRPTGQERNKKDLATSADEQIADMKSIIQKHPDIFGPGKGRLTDIETWLGSQDPDASRFRTARTLAADHAAGVFGGRSEEALKELNRALGMFHDNPEAALAGLEGFGKANKTFRDAGAMRVNGGNVTPTRPAGVPAEAVWNPETKRWRVP